MYQNIQSRLLKEVEEAIPKGQVPTYEQIESLHYLNNFTREVLRVYPPGTGNSAVFLGHTYLQELHSCIRSQGSGERCQNLWGDYTEGYSHYGCSSCLPF